MPPDSPTATPKELEGIGITEHLGAAVSVRDLHFNDENGKPTTIAELMRPGHPIILNLVYFECPNLCTFVLNGMVTSLKNLDWTVGNQFDIVTVSINPRETPKLATQKKAAYLAQLGPEKNAGAVKGWHFLTGSQDQISKLAGQVGYGYRYVEQEKQFAHAAAIFILTPEAKLSRYLYGIDYRSVDLKLALNEASGGKVGNTIERLLLYCYRFDPHTHRYSVVITRLMEAGSAGSTVLVGGYLAVFWGSERRKRRSERQKTKGA